MKNTINVLVIEDNEYYNNLLSNAIQQSVSSILLKGQFRLSLRSVTNAGEYMRKIMLDELECNNCIAFIDYNLGNGLNAEPIIRMLKERDPDTVIVLISQSKSAREESRNLQYDYFVVKDNLAPAFCCLYLRQFVENKFSVTLDQ
jgi:hypothetical protein